MQSHVAYSFYLATTATGCSQHMCPHLRAGVGMQWPFGSHVAFCLYVPSATSVALCCCTVVHQGTHHGTLITCSGSIPPQVRRLGALRRLAHSRRAAQRRNRDCCSAAPKQAGSRPRLRPSPHPSCQSPHRPRPLSAGSARCSRPAAITAASASGDQNRQQTTAAAEHAPQGCTSAAAVVSAPLPAPDATLQVVLQVVCYHSAYILTFAQGLATMPKVCAHNRHPNLAVTCKGSLLLNS